MVSSVGITMHDGPPSPHGDPHLHHSSRMEGPPPQMDYRHGPPGYGGPPPPPMPHGYPYPPPYYGGPTPPPPYGMPPGAYPPYYGHPGYGPPPPPQAHGAAAYGYGYDPNYGYPSQQPRDIKRLDSSKMPQRKPSSGRTSLTSPSPAPLLPESSPTSQQQPQWRAPSVSSESSPVAAAAADFVPSQVKPIETDFHFFVKEMSVVLRPAAEEEVKKSMAEKGSLVTPSDVMYLINSNLNTRLIKAWEDLTPEKRLEYMTKEENDRRRFMNEDSVASRHCATLTARNKSPRADGPSKSSKESRDAAEQQTGKPSPAQSTGSSGSDDVADDDDYDDAAANPHRNTSPDRKMEITHVKQEGEEEEQVTTPPSAEHKAKAEPTDEKENQADENNDTDNKSSIRSELNMEEIESTGGKRVGSPTATEEEEGTPTKRNRREGDSGDDLHTEEREAV